MNSCILVKTIKQNRCIGDPEMAHYKFVEAVIVPRIQKCAIACKPVPPEATKVKGLYRYEVYEVIASKRLFERMYPNSNISKNAKDPVMVKWVDEVMSHGEKDFKQYRKRFSDLSSTDEAVAPLTVKIYESTAEKLRKVAKERGMSISGLVEQCLSSGLSRKSVAK